MDTLFPVVAAFAVLLSVSWFANRMIRRFDADLPRDAMPRSEKVAEAILARNWVNDVRVDGGHGDFYSPMERRIELSEDRIDRGSTSAAAIAAHEAAHAVQHATRASLFMLVTELAIPSALASLAWWPAAVAAAIFDSDALAAMAFCLFAFTAVVAVLRSWVEVDASRRALRELRELFASGFDQRGARWVLGACGATYVTDALLDLGFIGRRLRREDGGGGGQSSGDDADGVIDGLLN